MFGMPAVGTMAHSWVQLYDTEYEAFKAWAEIYPNDCTLLVDTYNTIKSGIPNAIRVFDEFLKPKGIRPQGVRIDSGDITYLTKKCREMLDAAGYEDVGIVISNSLDEFIIRDVLSQGACIDSLGVGERLITSKSEPVFGGVYKLCAVEDKESGDLKPKIKISDNEDKITNPGFKKVYRIYEKGTDMAAADLITLHDEVIDESKPIEIFDPIYTWKKKKFRDYYIKELLVQIFDKGECIYESPEVMEIRQYTKEQVAKLWPEVLRFESPHNYYVDLSTYLWKLKHELIQKFSDEYEEK
jgi:nicotinate phosphoribosyltransferase